MTSGRRGFSLIAIAIVLLVLGTAVVLALLPKASVQFNKVSLTQNRINRIYSAVNSYYSMNGSTYPCPASFNKLLGNSSFGKAVTTSCAACSPVSGVYCPNTLSNYTWVGAVPIYDLGLSDDYEFDAWGNRFTYVVNNNQTFSLTDVNNANDKKPHFIIISHGPDGIGAFNRAGSLVKACLVTNLAGADIPPTTPASELENCNFVTAPTDDHFIYSPWNTTTGSTGYYDDLVGYKY